MRVRPAHLVLFGVLCLLGTLTQVAVLGPLPFPAGGRPQLLVLLVVVAGLLTGPLEGMLIGFAAGLFADLLPPADHTVGRVALVLTMVGYVAGLLRDQDGGSYLMASLLAGLSTAFVGVGYTMVGSFLGEPRSEWHVLAHTLPWSVLYDVVLAPVALWVAGGLLHRADPEVAFR
jgi:rod shape-determining protein MreD